MKSLLQKPERDQDAREGQKRFVNRRQPVASVAEPAEAVQPTDGPFDPPADHPESAAVGRGPLGQSRSGSAAPAGPPQRRRVGRPIAQDFVRESSRAAGPSPHPAAGRTPASRDGRPRSPPPPGGCPGRPPGRGASTPTCGGPSGPARSSRRRPATGPIRRRSTRDASRSRRPCSVGRGSRRGRGPRSRAAAQCANAAGTSCCNPRRVRRAGRPSRRRFWGRRRCQSAPCGRQRGCDRGGRTGAASVAAKGAGRSPRSHRQ